MVIILLINILFSQIDFDSPISFGQLKDSQLNEISGIEHSIKHNIIWCHNDSGGEPIIYGINVEGETVCKLILKDILNRDWEDVTYGEINGKYYIFIGDIGDNEKIYNTKYIYYFEEPDEIRNEIMIENINKITFTYPNQNYDSECLMFDPISKDLIIVSKRETKEKVFSISYPYNLENQIEVKLEVELPIGQEDNLFSWVTAGDISDDGKYILIKNYTNVYFWDRGEDLYSTIGKNGEDIKVYQQAGEPQGEAICWDNEKEGFYSISEERFGIKPELRYFRKLKNTNNIKKKSINEFDLNDRNLLFFDIIGNRFNYNDLNENNINLFLIYDAKTNQTYKILRHKF